MGNLVLNEAFLKNNKIQYTRLPGLLDIINLMPVAGRQKTNNVQVTNTNIQNEAVKIHIKGIFRSIIALVLFGI